jgi:hypothetical protein
MKQTSTQSTAYTYKRMTPTQYLSAHGRINQLFNYQEVMT